LTKYLTTLTKQFNLLATLLHLALHFKKETENYIKISDFLKLRRLYF